MKHATTFLARLSIVGQKKRVDLLSQTLNTASQVPVPELYYTEYTVKRPGVSDLETDPD